MWSQFNSIKNTSKLDILIAELKQRENKKVNKIQFVSTIQYNPNKLRFAQTRETLKAIGGR